MKIGFGAPVAGAWATPGYLAAFSEQAEEAGYASLWTFQRLLVPEGSGMDPVYRSVLDPMVALGFAAARTSRIRLGVAILNLPFVSPAYLAKQATTVDVLSGGRLDLGLGIGWMPEEFAVTGGSTARRGARTEEYLAVLRTLGRTRSAPTTASSTRSRRDGRIPGRCSSPDRRCCSAACPGRPWSGPGGSRRAGSPPAAPT
jgi:Coenzyme F420-dependent N5,N10-methylene tetrahydromethanopterin reductase and related flavin-dependent oxidoreductases